MPKSKETITDSESGSGSGTESEEEVKSKSKPKKVEKRKKQESSSDGSESEDNSKLSKKSKKSSNDDGKEKQMTNENGEPIWDIGNKKRITVRSFKNKWFVDIREMYEKDGKMLPGKKGISLNAENWDHLYQVAEKVNNVFSSK